MKQDHNKRSKKKKKKSRSLHETINKDDGMDGFYEDEELTNLSGMSYLGMTGMSEFFGRDGKKKEEKYRFKKKC